MPPYTAYTAYTAYTSYIAYTAIPHDLALFVLSAGALLIRVGLAWHATGAARSKNAAAAVLRSVADLAVAVLLFWAVGMAIFNGSFGYLFDAKSVAGPTQLVQLVLVLIATAPASGAMMERCRFFPSLAGSGILAAVLVPLAGHWAWHGWLYRMGFFDAAGASVVHVAGGTCALVAAMVVGPRDGKYNRDGSSNLIPGHSIPMMSVGVMLMLAGWLPLVIGSSMLHGGLGPRTPLNVLLAASSAAVAAMLLSNARYGKPDVVLTLSGLLGGLVAISGAAGAVHSVFAVAIGAVAGAIVPTLTVIIDLVWKIDDPAGGVGVHLVGGAWGTIAVGLFAPSAGFLDTLRQLGIQCLGLIVIAALSLGLSLAVFAALKATVRLRLTESAEYDGADLAEHDLNAYPDFQQTMIKSYHLREA